MTATELIFHLEWESPTAEVRVFDGDGHAITLEAEHIHTFMGHDMVALFPYTDEGEA